MCILIIHNCVIYFSVNTKIILFFCLSLWRIWHWSQGRKWQSSWIKWSRKSRPQERKLRSHAATTLLLINFANGAVIVYSFLVATIVFSFSCFTYLSFFVFIFWSHYPFFGWEYSTVFCLHCEPDSYYNTCTCPMINPTSNSLFTM